MVRFFVIFLFTTLFQIINGDGIIKRNLGIEKNKKLIELSRQVVAIFDRSQA